MHTTILVPTYNEADNVSHLISRLRDACANMTTRVLFIDDSPDDLTVDAIIASSRSLGRTDFAVDYEHRIGPEATGGLAGAVTQGLRHCDTEFVVVMDGDLQHPPELVPSLVARVHAGADVVIASRYCEGGKADGLDGPLRHFVSVASTQAAKLFCPAELKGVTDPMTGFFALRLASIDLSRLQPKGFKILLEILKRNPHVTKEEVPLNFAPRENGQSKGGFRQGLQFARQLVDLRTGT